MLGYGEMDDNNAATYTMQGSNYNDTRKPQGERILMRPPYWYMSCDYTAFVIRPYDKCRIIA